MFYADHACTYSEELNPHRYVFKGKCIGCGEIIKVAVPGEALWKYRQGARIQDAMPMLSAGEREFLISGMCDSCFNKMFKEK